MFKKNKERSFVFNYNVSDSEFKKIIDDVNKNKNPKEFFEECIKTYKNFKNLKD